MWLTALSRLATLFIVLIPAIVPGKLRIPLFFATVFIAFTLQAQTTVVINQWMLQFVDEKKSGHTISLRQTLTTVVTVGLSIAGGQWMDRMGGEYKGFLILFAAAVFGICELISLAGTPDSTETHTTGGNAGFRDIIRLPQIVLLSVWGKVSDRRGHAFVLRTSIWLFAGETLFMSFASPKSWFVFIPTAFLVSSSANRRGLYSGADAWRNHQRPSGSRRSPQRKRGKSRMSKIDLHIHSLCSSDGELSPEEIMARCRARGMRLCAVTDHNSVRGVSAAIAAAEGLRVIPGVELDCMCKGRNFHLLGYGIDCMRPEFTAIEQNIVKQEKSAAEEKVVRFRKATGIPISTEEALAASDSGIVTGELIAELLLGRADAGGYETLLPYLPGGAKSDMPNVRLYWDFFSEGKPAFVPIRYLSLEDAISLIHSAGGSAVLAHPGQNLAGEDGLLTVIIAEGIDGIEAFSSYHDRKTALHYLEAAKRNRLFVTCGSDFHGKHKPGIVLGGHGAVWSDDKLMEELEGRF